MVLRSLRGEGWGGKFALFFSRKFPVLVVNRRKFVPLQRFLISISPGRIVLEAKNSRDCLLFIGDRHIGFVLFVRLFVGYKHIGFILLV